MTIGAGAQVVLRPGVYVIGGPGFRCTSGSMVTGTGVTLVIAKGAFDVSGACTITLAAPASGSLQGVAIAQPRANTLDMKLSGGASVKITGSLYAPAAAIGFFGNSTLHSAPAGNSGAVIAGRVALVGTSGLKISGTANGPAPYPSMPLFD